MRTTIARRPLTPLARCSGISAVWCPIHGDCTCPRSDDGDFPDGMNDEGCPLHSRTSPHPIRTAVAL